MDLTLFWLWQGLHGVSLLFASLVTCSGLAFWRNDESLLYEKYISQYSNQAEFELRLLRKDGWTSLSNMPILSRY